MFHVKPGERVVSKLLRDVANGCSLLEVEDDLRTRAEHSGPLTQERSERLEALIREVFQRSVDVVLPPIEEVG